MFKLLSSVALFALLAIAFASDAEKNDQSADEVFFATYGYYPTAAARLTYGYNNVAGYPAVAYTGAYPVAYQAGLRYQPVAYPSTYAYPAAAYPFGYQAFPAGVVAAPAKKA